MWTKTKKKASIDNHSIRIYFFVTMRRGMPENLSPERAKKTVQQRANLQRWTVSDMRLWAVLFLAGCSSAEPVTLQTALKSKLFFPFVTPSLLPLYLGRLGR